MARAQTTVDTRSNSISIKGKKVPIASNENPGSLSPADKAFATKAEDLKKTAIAYNPKADPKYDPMASANARAFATGDSVAFKPGQSMGKSLVGHELTHVVQQ